MKDEAAKQLILALDFGSLPEAIRIVKKLRGRFGLVKVGSELFTVAGPAGVRKLAPLVPGIFLDLKFCDIPNTVAKAVLSATRLPKIRLVTLHTTGGFEMMRAAKEAVADIKNAPKLLGVTVLTSLDDEKIRRIGLAGSVATRVEELAKLAMEAGMDGVVASPQELPMLRRALGERMLLVTPGVRPTAGAAWTGSQDQARIATPGEAVQQGADYLVVGRAITSAADPVKAATAIIEEIATARKTHTESSREKSATNQG